MLSLDLFNTKYERELREGAVDDLEARRIDTLNDRMQDLLGRAKESNYKNNPAALAGLKREYQRFKDERDSYYKVREAGIPGNVPTEKIPGKEDLLKGRGRSYYEDQKKNSEQVDEYISMGSDKNYQEAEPYKNYRIYVRKKPFGPSGMYTAHTEIDRKEFKEPGSSQEEAVQAIRDRIDFVLNAQRKVTGSSTIDFNVKFATDLLADPRQTFYAKLEKINGEPKLVIASPDIAGDPELLAAGDFKRSALRNQVDDSGRATPLPGIPLTAKGLRSGDWIANGRYTVGQETQDRDGNRVFDLTYHSTAHTKSDKLRLNQPAFTLGTAREVDEHGGGIGPRQHWQDLMPEQMNPEDYEDEDEDDRLRSGDYVRDTMDGEAGEIFRMQGDPYERRVRILDRDGRGWYIEPSRLIRVDPQDPDVQRYFGKQHRRDMDEMDKSQPSQERHGDRALGAKGTTATPVAARKVVKDLAMDLDQAFAKQKPVKEKGVAEESRGSATRRGQQDYAKGLTRQQNPYYKSQQGNTPPEAYDWEAGWEHARDAGKEPGVEEGWKSTVGGAALAGAMALGAGGAQARVAGDNVDNPDVNRLTGKPNVAQTVQGDQAKPTAPSGYSKAYLQSVVDGSHPRPMVSKEKAQELLNQLREQDVSEGWSDAMLSRRTGQPRTPYTVYIKGRKWKDFENDDLARAVMNRLKAKFKADGRDPETITIAPTDYDRPIKEEQDTSGVERAILNRIMVAHTDLLMKFGPDKVMQAAEEVAYNVGDVDEIGTSDVSAYVAQVKQILGATA